jgi:hypothetical protein
MQSSDADAPRERCRLRHGERQRSNPDGPRKNLDCLIAVALAMTRTHTFTSRPPKGRPGRRKPHGREGSGAQDPTRFPGRPSGGPYGKTRAQTRRGNNHGRRAAAAMQCPTVAHPTVKQMSSFSNLYDAGPWTNPKRASPVFIRLYANRGFAYAAFSAGSERTSYFLLHCGWGQLQECCMRAIGTLMLSLICCLFAFSPARAQIAIGISIDVAPPPLPVYDPAADSGGRLHLDARLLGLG